VAIFEIEPGASWRSGPDDIVIHNFPDEKSLIAYF
jgi:hypothetical protein